MTPPRSLIRPGLTVDVIQKHHQASGQLTRGVVAALLTNSASHPHGIKVRLTSGVVGRVQALVPAQS
ncbi:YwbE family protein [Deinococcus detaillensis]|uniref:YwbE family protein n=1 Tax=Deinococcus detaillensis TaxID=2592048 RepID=A0A553UWR2_9DEIO|nr:YwbE family protein [Deinococcus detaillensis]TSA84642.1 YwbE family protein [Deinococcus detaillensis]